MSTAAFNEMVADPMKFLGKYLVFTKAYSTSSGERDWEFYLKPGGVDTYVVDKPYGQADDHHQFKTHYVHTQGYSANTASNEIFLLGYEMRDDCSPDIMVTALLNGCTFMLLKTPAGIKCAHIQPKGIQAGEMRAELTGRHLQGNPTEAVNLAFGQELTGSPGGASTYSWNRAATVIGLRDTTANKWALYAQTSLRGGKGEDLRVEQIY